MSQTDQQHMHNPSSWRYRLVLGLFALAALAVAAQVVRWQVVERQFLQNEGDKRSIRHAEIVAHRGMILDRNGEPLAVSTPMMAIWANPRELIEQQARWPELARALELKPARLAELIEKMRARGFIYLKRQLTPQQGARVLALKVPGVYGREEYRRYYPAGEVSAHVVGFTNIDDQGQEGMELAFDEWVTGTPGKVRMVKDRRGDLVRSTEVLASAEPGKPLQLSLDLRLQYRAYRSLQEAVNHFRARSGSAVVLDVETGEVLAMVNQPSYNPNNRTRLKIADARNRAVTDVFEPGSTVKPLTVAAALESGHYRANSVLDTSPGWMVIGNKTIKDIRNYGAIDLATVIKKSSNIGVTKLALDLGGERIWQMFWDAGLGQATSTGFPGESAGILPSHRRWRPLETATLSYGYGLSVTALQLASAYATIAADGLRRPVSLIKQTELPAGEQVIDPNVARAVQQMMAQVVERGGTGTRAAIPGYRVAGKTGTARKLTAGDYDDSRHVAFFAGFAPVSHPRLVTVVVINDPSNGESYGGTVAAPVFARIMGDSLRLLGVAPDKQQRSHAQLARAAQ